jgi:predicted nucleic acid-binding protein
VARARKEAEGVAEEAVVAEDAAAVEEAVGVLTLAEQVQRITAHSLNLKIFGRSFIWQNSIDVRMNLYQFIRTLKIRSSAHHSTTLTFKKLGLVFEV